jgi:DNA-binding NarL/FixJ family response regulator
MGYAQRIRVFLLHNDPIAHAGLATALSRYPDFEIVNPEADIEVGPNRGNTDVVLADYANGIDLAQPASRRGAADSEPRILIVATGVREWEVRCALARGVLGYVLAGSGLDELAAAIRAVRLGVRHLSPQVAQNLADCLSGDPLTYRETQVLRLVVEGLPNKAIARRLDIAVGTVKSHLKGVFDKLNVDSRTQAICAAERRGLLCEEPNMPRRRVAHDPTMLERRAGP